MEEHKIERAVLAGLAANCFTKEQQATENSLDELEALLQTAGGTCVAKVLQTRPAPDAHSFVGQGKAEEIRDLAQNLEADMVVFDNELSPSQIRALEDVTGCTVLDRSALILDIFAQRAQTAEGRLQVELAQYRYLLPKLSGMGKSMSRLGGGIGTRGPGETKLETDRRHIRTRIDRLQAELAQVRKLRAVERKRRVKNEIPVVAIVGYTNAGKSTLLNLLTQADIPANNRLFDTLDTTTRQWEVTEHLSVLLSDTVGFIAKLPHHLVEAFKATLEELEYADLLLHVIDAADPDRDDEIAVVDKLIGELARPETPVLRVYNKCDLAARRTDRRNLRENRRRYRRASRCDREGAFPPHPARSLLSAILDGRAGGASPRSGGRPARRLHRRGDRDRSELRRGNLRKPAAL